MLGNAWVATQLAVFQEGLRPMELVIKYDSIMYNTSLRVPLIQQMQL
jgi:hypothetical protein